MDQIRVDQALNELKSARERLANLEQDQASLAERLAAARRAQRRISYYLVGLIILFSLVMAGAFTLTL
jgi:multidrug resistance efflux pump